MITPDRTSHLNDRHKLILGAVHRELTRLRGVKVPPAFCSDNLMAHEWYAAIDARQGLIRLDLESWLGRVPTPSDRTLYRRAWCQLAQLGLVKLVDCVSYGNTPRTSHLKLTRAGMKLAKTLSAGNSAGANKRRRSRQEETTQ